MPALKVSEADLEMQAGSQRVCVRSGWPRLRDTNLRRRRSEWTGKYRSRKCRGLGCGIRVKVLGDDPRTDHRGTVSQKWSTAEHSSSWSRTRARPSSSFSVGMFLVFHRPCEVDELPTGSPGARKDQLERKTQHRAGALANAG